MAKQIQATPTAGRHAAASSRTVLLAGLGAASLARKQAIKAFDRLVTEGQAIRGSLQLRQDRLQRDALQRIEQVRGAVLPLAADAMEQAGRLRGYVAVRAEPLLARAGIVLPAALRTPTVAKPAARKPARQATTRKAAAKPARKPIAPRKRTAGARTAR